MKFLILVGLLFPILVHSKTEDYFTLSNEKKCFVKRYKDKKFFEADPKKFYRIRIWAIPHHKNERYSVFRYNDSIFLTLTSCLNPVNIENGNFEDLIDSEPQPSDREVTRASNSRIISDELRYSENKYFLEIEGGGVRFGDKNQIFPYDELDGTHDGDTYDFHKPVKTSYKGGGSISIGGGWRVGEQTFLALKFKHYSGSKKENVPVTVNGMDGEAEFKYSDEYSSLLFGPRFVFLDGYHLKPVISFYIGANRISSTIQSDTKLEFESTGLSALGEIGFQYLFTSNFGISLTGGYEYLGASRKFRLKKKDETVNEGFTSKMNYSSTFVNFGIVCYFK